MRNLLIVALLLSSCTFTKQQKAESLIKKYLNEHLNDPHSYEIVGFGKLDTAKGSYLVSPDYSLFEDSITKIGTDIAEARMNLEYPTLYNSKKQRRKIQTRTKDSIYYKAKQDSVINNFKEVQTGWLITHTYRAKNGFGGLGLHSTIFEMNTALDTVKNEIENK